jgi:hypothetical protein
MSKVKEVARRPANARRYALTILAVVMSVPATARADGTCGQWIARSSLVASGMPVLTAVEGSDNPVEYELYRSDRPPELFAYTGGPGLHLRALSTGVQLDSLASVVFVDNGPVGGTDVCGYVAPLVDSHAVTGASSRGDDVSVVVDTNTDPPTLNAFHRPLSLEAVAAIPLGRTHRAFSPFGELGAAVDYDPWSFLELSAGLGEASGGGTAEGALGRLRLVLTDNWGIGAGLGASAFQAGGQDNHFGEAELFTEYRDAGFLIRVSLGKAEGTGGASASCVTSGLVTNDSSGPNSCAPPSPASSSSPTYASLAFGWTF